MNTERVIVDEQAGKRYEHLIAQGKRYFSQTNLLTTQNAIVVSDLEAINDFHTIVAPTHPNYPWRLETMLVGTTMDERKEHARSLVACGQIADPSYYSNWDIPGGPGEHLKLATDAGFLIPLFLQYYIKDSRQQELIQNINPYHTAAAAALHDMGRLVTHLPIHDKIGKRLLHRIGIRPDIITIIPNDTVYFQTPLDQSLNVKVMTLNPLLNIITLADNFGKRFPSSSKLSNRIYIRSDFTPEKMYTWAQSYTSKPFSGRPSQREFAKKIMTHNQNESRVFDALNHWIEQVTTANLDKLVQFLKANLEPNLLANNHLWAYQLYSKMSTSSQAC